jgi:hypothetical protein
MIKTGNQRPGCIVTSGQVKYICVCMDARCREDLSWADGLNNSIRWNLNETRSQQVTHCRLQIVYEPTVRHTGKLV